MESKLQLKSNNKQTVISSDKTTTAYW